jgi:RpiB/LacA/LacB family sugar-phosphate isomerase
MRIAAGSDHAGFELKQAIVERLRDAGHEVDDLGTHEAEVSVDYPRYAHRVARAVQRGEVDRGLLVCGTGIGMCMAANRHPGVRAADCNTVGLAEMSRRHNDANVLCLGGRELTVEQAWAITVVWFATPFDGDRHISRVAQIDESGEPGDE